MPPTDVVGFGTAAPAPPTNPRRSRRTPSRGEAELTPAPPPAPAHADDEAARLRARLAELEAAQVAAGPVDTPGPSLLDDPDDQLEPEWADDQDPAEPAEDVHQSDDEVCDGEVMDPEPAHNPAALELASVAAARDAALAEFTVHHLKHPAIEAAGRAARLAVPALVIVATAGAALVVLSLAIAAVLVILGAVL